MKKWVNSYAVTITIIVAFSMLLVGYGMNRQDAKASGETIVLRLGQSKAASHPVSKGIDKFAEIVEKKSNGEIEIETYHDAVLGSDREVIEGAQQGSLDLASSSTPNMSSFTKLFNAWDLPYIFESKKEVYQAIDGEPGDVIRKALSEKGFQVIFFPDYGFRQIVNNVKPIQVPSDLEGLKIRTTSSPIEQADFEAFGANPTPIAWQEVFTALQQGTVEGEGNSYSLLWDTKHQEVLQYATEVNYNYSSDIVLMNKEIFKSLSEEHQQVIMEAGEEAVSWQRELANMEEEEARKKFQQFGIEIYEPTEEQMKIWHQSIKPVWKEFVREGKADPEYVNLILNTLGKTKKEVFQE
ncbi:TRAP transporter substrate-binding protein [Pontibacillus salicampi]|uniref:TRAP transporter substrate-binding protein n=1 Tax=Pontibacillus salicampi TaxID=1449801 RepID=A0ABV6LR09_9BACI